VLGAIAGDVIGSVYEWDNIKTKDFPLLTDDSFFTDDTVLTVALADAVLSGTDYAKVMKTYYMRYPHAGYGGRFHEWASSDDLTPYFSWGNGAAMRISPSAYAYDTLEKVLRQAALFTGATHNHPEGIKGGQATAAAIFIGRTGGSKTDIRSYIERTFGYDLSRTVAEIRPTYKFNESCQGTVPEALTCFLESTDFEDAIRNSISIGGDSDTIACIAGAVAEGFYGKVPDHIAKAVLQKLDPSLRKVTLSFMRAHMRNPSGA
jgi:ADP-ribosylglycohydrolase